eukprot:m.66299 g.66299  ORF g.66299 m.66299 type:complete len:439 (-) comp49872_c0_seq1:114-1430(-)
MARFFENTMEDPAVRGLHTRLLEPDTLLRHTAALKDWLLRDLVDEVKVSESPYVYSGLAGSVYALLRFVSAMPTLPELEVVAILTTCATALNKCFELMKRRSVKRSAGVSLLYGESGIAIVAIAFYSALEQIRNSSGIPQLQMSLAELAALVESASPQALEADECEVLYGKAGYLSACLHLNALGRRFSLAAQRSTITTVIHSIFSQGIRTARSCRNVPDGVLVFFWHDSFYLGAAHGIAGILTVLLQAHLEGFLTAPQLHQVRVTINHLLKTFVLSDGNLMSSAESSGGSRLVQWCHGAVGLIQLLNLADLVFGATEEDYFAHAVKASTQLWARGLLTKGFGLCHGAPGNAYAFLTLAQMSTRHAQEDVALANVERAHLFAWWMFAVPARFAELLRKPDAPSSLYEGYAGALCFLLQLQAPQLVAFPLYELPGPPSA